MTLVFKYFVFLISVVIGAAAMLEPQGPTNIFERNDGWAVNCPAPPWSHTYTKSHVQETLQLLRSKMNKKCARSYLKTEEQNYKPVHVSDKDKSEFKCYPAHLMTTVPNNPSPKILEKLGNTPGCRLGQRGKTYIEFPIKWGLYTGGDPELHRIVAIADLRQGQLTNAQYCLTMYHVPGPKPEFRPCDGSSAPL